MWALNYQVEAAGYSYNVNVCVMCLHNAMWTYWIQGSPMLYLHDSTQGYNHNNIIECNTKKYYNVMVNIYMLQQGVSLIMLTCNCRSMQGVK